MKRAEIEKPWNCACFNLRRAARRLSQAYDRALKPIGLQGPQFSLLAVLDKAGAGEGITMQELAALLGMDRTTLTRNLAVAERRGWARVVEGADRRERRVRSTAAGRAKLKAALPLWRAAQERTRKELGSEGFAQLLEITRQIAA